jgi:NADH dehydrogenase (ubiquinone) 1 alpha subcomplex subunit 2
VLGSYAELKKANPDTPILVRECSGTEAKLTARFGAWKQRQHALQQYDVASVQRQQSLSTLGLRMQQQQACKQWQQQ